MHTTDSVLPATCQPAAPVLLAPSRFSASQALHDRFHAAIPGGSHTYAKGDDQFPAHMAPYLVRGRGCRVWDVDGNAFVEYGMGLRSVTLGHAYAPVVRAAQRAMTRGTNLGRPTTLELATAEEFLEFTQAGDMVKFAKNGSDVNTAALRLARAYTGRDLVAVCADHPFFATDDWFIGTTPVRAGIPQAVQGLTLRFRYNDLGSVEQLFREHPGQIACLFLEIEKEVAPAAGFLEGLRSLCDAHGTVLVFDEVITGFRWHHGGAQAVYGVRPDLSTFAKAMGNGFSIAALTGKRELMELGGLHHNKERVFLLSTTYGAESHALAATRAVMATYRQEPVIEHLREAGSYLRRLVEPSIAEHGLEQHFALLGPPQCLLYATRDAAGQPSQEFRTLFLQETLRRGLLLPSLIVSYAHQPADIELTAECIHEALRVYRRGLDDGVESVLESRSVKPVYRTRN
ncbi:glutamate-1-semialdehyde 2,1-aminomutase [Hymenobacter busanensis]|uniref:Glutamate-1-semialdehyde 2,1-aminomutase n=1 Tax=Hymenobacter busanensis TaxID=2607656 RepID=A0A7L4ZZT6_9BACT|nr:glutamate-1-semialdehyde 2,1-aminomutase [Hymenobacter busanensis]KAA9339248.1 glutamate-1-semialdehyde 2,1-aminomutase [Hymenobacter busanensis]QHJ06990.1 glutamate-1-semialdehyde 2,1-aminomutase [Hymenobacter busanensis]